MHLTVKLEYAAAPLGGYTLVKTLVHTLVKTLVHTLVHTLVKTLVHNWCTLW